MLPWQPFVFSVLHHFWDEETKKLELFSSQLPDQAQIWQSGLFLGPEFKLIKNFHILRHFDVTMTKDPF